MISIQISTMLVGKRVYYHVAQT